MSPTKELTLLDRGQRLQSILREIRGMSDALSESLFPPEPEPGLGSEGKLGRTTLQDSLQDAMHEAEGIARRLSTMVSRTRGANAKGSEFRGDFDTRFKAEPTKEYRTEAIDDRYYQDIAIQKQQASEMACKAQDASEYSKDRY
jgi:hypothetical protein